MDEKNAIWKIVSNWATNYVIETTIIMAIKKHYERSKKELDREIKAGVYSKDESKELLKVLSAEFVGYPI